MNYKILLVIAILFLYISCGDSSSTQMLSPEVKYMSDTMYAKRRAMIMQEMDSLCLLQHKSLMQEAIDSLLIIEIERIKELSE